MIRSFLFKQKGRELLASNNEFDIEINELVRSKMDEIMSLDIAPFVLAPEIAGTISSILELEGNTREELQNKRDSFVILLRDYMEERVANIRTVDDIFGLTKHLTAVTTVIDSYLVNFEEEQ